MKNLWCEVGKVGFHLMQILDFFAMYFDAVVVFVTHFSLLFRFASTILWPIYEFASRNFFFFFFLKGSWKVSFLTVRFDNFVHFNLNRQFIPCRKSKQRKFCGLKFQNSWKNVMTSLQTLEICQNDCILFLYTQWNWGTFNQL